MLKLLCKKVPRVDVKSFDVEVYKPENISKPVVTYKWWQSNRPNKRNKYLNHNCATYQIEWVE